MYTSQELPREARAREEEAPPDSPLRIKKLVAFQGSRDLAVRASFYLIPDESIDKDSPHLRHCVLYLRVFLLVDCLTFLLRRWV